MGPYFLYGIEKPTHPNNLYLFIRTSIVKDQRYSIWFSLHKLCTCETFSKMTVPDRKDVQFANISYNCLNFGHQIKTCKFFSCPKCNHRHNSKLNEDTSSRDEF